MEFVGRGPQLDLLRGCYEGRDVNLVQVTGPEGIGKTTLVRKFVEGLEDGTLVALVDFSGIRRGTDAMREVAGSIVDALRESGEEAGVFSQGNRRRMSDKGEEARAIQYARGWRERRPVIVFDFGGFGGEWKQHGGDTLKGLLSEMCLPPIEGAGKPPMVITASGVPVIEDKFRIPFLEVKLPGLKFADLVEAGISEEAAHTLMEWSNGHPATVKTLYGNGGEGLRFGEMRNRVWSGRHFGLPEGSGGNSGDGPSEAVLVGVLASLRRCGFGSDYMADGLARWHGGAAVDYVLPAIEALEELRMAGAVEARENTATAGIDYRMNLCLGRFPMLWLERGKYSDDSVDGKLWRMHAELRNEWGGVDGAEGGEAWVRWW